MVLDVENHLLPVLRQNVSDRTPQATPGSVQQKGALGWTISKQVSFQKWVMWTILYISLFVDIIVTGQERSWPPAITTCSSSTCRLGGSRSVTTYSVTPLQSTFHGKYKLTLSMKIISIIFLGWTTHLTSSATEDIWLSWYFLVLFLLSLFSSSFSCFIIIEVNYVCERKLVSIFSIPSCTVNSPFIHWTKISSMK